MFESTWSLKAHATDVLSGKQQSNAGRIQAQQAKNAASKKRTNKKITQEPQGPVDWSIRYLSLEHFYNNIMMNTIYYVFMSG